MAGLGLGLGASKLLRSAAAFTIDSITSLVLWLQGDDTAYLNSKLAAQFTSANSEFLSSASTDFDKADVDFSFGGWVNMDTTTLNQGLMGQGIGSYQMNFRNNTGNGFRFLGTSPTSGVVIVDTGTVPVVGTWYFVVCVHDSVNDLIKISVDGAAFVTTACVDGLDAAASDLWFGRQATIYSSIKEDSMFFYDKALTIAQVGALYNSGTGVDYADYTADMLVSLVSLWRMDEASGTRADAHGSNTLTDNNTVTSALGKVVDTPVIDVSQIWRIVDRSTNGDIYDQDTATAQPAWASLTPNSLDYDGTTDYLDITGALTSYLSTSTKGFMCAWVRPTSLFREEFIICFGDANALEFISLYKSGTDKLFFRCFDGGVEKWRIEVDDAMFGVNTWVHVGAVSDSVLPVVYVNGIAVDQTEAVGGGADTTIYFSDCLGIDSGRIGDRVYNSSGEASFVDGAIDQVLIGNDEITAATMLDIYNSGLATHP